LSTSESLELELKQLIIDALALEDVSPANIEPTAALFVEGLGLDSIDALELAMALEERYGVQIGDDPELNRQIFASVRNLAAYVGENRVSQS
jgi:acyl carrier protein